MEKRFLLVDAQVLPEVFLQVLHAKELLAAGRAKSISAAVREAGVSRSAFYKYKDSIFEADGAGDVITVTATLLDETGALHSLLEEMYRAGASVVTINQSMPESGTGARGGGAAHGQAAPAARPAAGTPARPAHRGGYPPQRAAGLNTGQKGEKTMAKVAILGFGTVGSGVLEVLRTGAQGLARRAGEAVEVKYICDIRDFSAHPDAALFVNSIEPILSDGEVRVVVETIGGLDPAYYYVRSALESGRHVVTSNKELVATRGAELLRIARDNGVCFLFEASVGGGTPVITPMYQCLSANRIGEVLGVVNGTTNFMLTKMSREGLSFDEALREAQRLGYAETIDPSADVDGVDAQRKISILASIALGRHIYPQDVPARGIRTVSTADIDAARQLGYAVRLIARMACPQDNVLAPTVCVEPMLVPNGCPLAHVDDVYNAVAAALRTCWATRCSTGAARASWPTGQRRGGRRGRRAARGGAAIHDSLFWDEALPLGEGRSCADKARGDWYIRVRGDGAVPCLESVACPGARAGLLRARTEAEIDALRESGEANGFAVENWMRVLA